MTDLSGVPTIDVIHKHIHDGHWWTLDVYNAAVLTNGFLDLLVTTLTQPVHVRLLARMNASVLLTVYEDTGSIIGSPEITHTLVNRNRSLRASKFTPPVTVIEAPALSSPLGTLIAGPVLLPAAKQGGSVIFAGTGEYIMKENSKYLFRAQNIDNATQAMSVQLDVYS